MQLSLFCIVLNNADGLRKMLSSCSEFFDDIVVCETDCTDSGETYRAAREFTDRIYNFNRPDDFEWVEDFSAARNFAMSKCVGDYIVWLDSDDVAIGFRRLRSHIESLCEGPNPKADCLFLRYNYAYDEHGNPSVVQNRERVLRGGMYEWRAPVHEVAIPTRHHKAISIAGDGPYVSHEGAIGDRQCDPARLTRNLAILERYESKHGELDTRMSMYKANSLYGLSRYKEAIPYYDKYIDESGFDEERYVAMCSRVSCIENIYGRDKAIEESLKTILFMPDQPRAYTNIAQMLAEDEDYNRAYFFAKKATECTKDTSHVACNPLDKLAFPSAIMQICCLHTGRYEESVEWGRRAASFFRNNESVLGMLNKAENVMRTKVAFDAAMSLKKEYENAEEPEKEKKFMECVPKIIEDLKPFSDVMLLGNRSTSKPRIVFFCGDSSSEWGPQSVYEGVGGSEEAVINIAYEFRDLGWEAEVFGNPPMSHQGDYSGVRWLPYYVFDEENNADVFVSWRHHQYIAAGKNCGQRHLWLHDKQHTAYPQRTLDAIDSIFVLSRYHRNDPGLREVPEEKIFYTSNGLNEAFLADPGNNIATTAGFFSSPDRGLDLTLELWPYIKAKVPSAELRVFYGFTKTYEEMSKSNNYLKMLKEKIMDLMKQPGVSFYGMIGQVALARHMSEIGVWLYPTQWPETSCITAMKAAAMGCIPVTSGYGVLPETLEGVKDYGPTDEDDLIYANEDRKNEFVECAVNAMKIGDNLKEERISNGAYMREKYSWKTIALKWQDHFFSMMDEERKSLILQSKQCETLQKA